MDWFYISFATGNEFLGATVVEGIDPMDALADATRRGLNPGGEAAILYIPPKTHNSRDVKCMLNKLFSEKDMVRLGAIKQADLPEEIRQAFNQDCIYVCPDCNDPDN